MKKHKGEKVKQGLQGLNEMDSEATMVLAVNIATRIVGKMGFRKSADEAENIAIVQLAAAIFPRLNVVEWKESKSRSTNHPT